MKLSRNLTIAAAAVGLVLVAGTAQAGVRGEGGNRMVLGEFYFTHVGETQPQVEFSCSCTGTVSDQWTTTGPNDVPVSHKRVTYADSDDHDFRVSYVERDNAWVVVAKYMVADGYALPFRSNRPA